MAVFTVDSDAVLHQSAAVTSSGERVRGEVAGMLGQLTQLQSSWTGQAASAFQAMIEQWRGAQRTVDEALATINQSLAIAGRQYSEAEVANLSLFR